MFETAIHAVPADSQEAIEISDTADSASGKRTTQFDSESAKRAAARSAEVRKQKAQERREQGAGSARRVNRGKRTPLDALRATLEDAPDAYAAGIARMIEKGDPRALGLMERLFADAAHAAPTASTVAEIEAMDVEQLKAYIGALEAQAAASGSGHERLVTS